jgi:hypothetical protein
MTRLVLAISLSMVALGCSSDDGDEPAGGSGGGGGTSGASASDGTDATGGTGAVGGDGGSGATGERPYANVVGVAVTGEEGAYSFAVTVESADIDCTQYADWWEVLTDSGTLIYRRILEHSHTDENGTTDADAPGNTFTRSGGPVDVAGDEVVVVRAHMSNEGYNGAAFSGTAGDGFVEAVDIDSDFAPEVESEEPLPTECLF